MITATVEPMNVESKFADWMRTWESVIDGSRHEDKDALSKFLVTGIEFGKENVLFSIQRLLRNHQSASTWFEFGIQGNEPYATRRYNNPFGEWRAPHEFMQRAMRECLAARTKEAVVKAVLEIERRAPVNREYLRQIKLDAPLFAGYPTVATVEPTGQAAWRQLGHQVWRQLHAGVRLSWGTVKATKFDGDRDTNIDVDFSVTPDAQEDVGKITGGVVMIHNGWFVIKYVEKLSSVASKNYGKHWDLQPGDKPAKVIEKLKFLLDPNHVHATVEPGAGFTAQRGVEIVDTMVTSLKLPRTTHFHVDKPTGAAYAARDRCLLYFDVLTVAPPAYREYAFVSEHTVQTNDQVGLSLTFDSLDADEVKVQATVINKNAGSYKFQTQTVAVKSVQELRKTVSQLLGEAAHKECADLEAKYAHWAMFQAAIGKLDFDKHLHANVVLKETTEPFISSGDEVHRFKFKFTYGPDKKLHKDLTFSVNYAPRLKPAEVWFEVLQPKSREVRTESVDVPLESTDQFVARITALFGGFVLTNRSRLNALNS